MKKVLIGCAIAAGLVVIATIVGSIALFQFAKRSLPDTDQMEVAYDDLLATYGSPEEYQPPLQLAPQRIDQFVAVRESLSVVRAEVAERIYSIQSHARDTGSGLGKIKSWIELGKEGVGVAGSFLRMAERGVGLLHNAEMGVGEYAWLTGLTTYSLLDWNAETSIEIRDETEDDDRDDVLDAVTEMERDYRRLIRTQIQNLLATHEQRTLTGEEQAVFDLVRAHWTEIEGDRDRFPFRGSMPEPWAAVLRPRLEQLRAALPRTGMGLIMEQRFNLGTGGEELFDDGGGLQVEFNDR